MTTIPKTPPQRVLLIDDDPDIHGIVAAMLQPQCLELMRALDGDQGREAARHCPPDLILLDYDLRCTTGLDVLRQIRDEPALASIPVVLITGNDSHKVLTASFQAGAADYIRKPFCAAEIRARVQSVLDRKRMFDQLEKLALHDTLTGLANRASVQKMIQAAIDHAQDTRSALLFLDFDRFKCINDSFGHDVGDQLLKQIADRLRSAVRKGDHLARSIGQNAAARLGGDEFVVLLTDLADSSGALQVADRLLARLSEPYALAGRMVYSTASIGVVADLQAYDSPRDVLRDADTAMYEAKSRGRGRYVLFDTSMHARVMQRLTIEYDLRRAVENGEFFLEYQPIVSLETRRTEGFEALVRWNHPQRGRVMPGDFLSVAEETGLIVNIGKWAVHQACRDFASWQRSLGDMAPSHIHVNLSRQQLTGSLVETVADALAKNAMAPECLHLEVTESEIMQDATVARSTLEELRNLSVKIDMDDFGTGYSSLACLKDLPIDVLKIDRSFIVNMERSHSYAALVHAVMTLGQNLGLTTVAEGIETQDQLAMLQTMDCHYGQGYLFSKPMPAYKIRDYLCPTDEPVPATLPSLAESISFSTAIEPISS